MRTKRAFTLIELIITTTIFGVVMISIFSAFRSGIFGYDNITANLSIYRDARLIMDRLNLDLRNSFPYSKAKTYFSGEKEKIQFFSVIDTYSEGKLLENMCIISYRLDQNKLFRLCRKNQDALKDALDPNEEEMTSEAESLTFSYGFLNKETDLMEFSDLCPDGIDLPNAVKIKLALKHNKIKKDFERTFFLPL